MLRVAPPPSVTAVAEVEFTDASQPTRLATVVPFIDRVPALVGSSVSVQEPLLLLCATERARTVKAGAVPE